HVRCHHHLACGSPGDRHRRHCVRLYCYCCLCSCWARFHTLLYCPEIRVAVLGLASLLHPVRVLSGHRCFCCLRHRKSDYRNHGPSAEGHYLDRPNRLSFPGIFYYILCLYLFTLLFTLLQLSIFLL